MGPISSDPATTRWPRSSRERYGRVNPLLWLEIGEVDKGAASTVGHLHARGPEASADSKLSLLGALGPPDNAFSFVGGSSPLLHTPEEPRGSGSAKYFTNDFRIADRPPKPPDRDSLHYERGPVGGGALPAT